MSLVRPAAGAFATSEQSQAPAQVPRPQVGNPSVSDPTGFLAKLQGLGAMAPSPQAMPPAAPAPMPAAPVSRGTSPLDSLASMVASAPPAPAYPSRPQRRPAAFVPGKPGKPNSGMTAHEILKAPEMVKALRDGIAAWEQANPGRQLMATHLQDMLPDASAAQLRTIKRKLDSAMKQKLVANIEGLMGRGALKASKGGV